MTAHHNRQTTKSFDHAESKPTLSHFSLLLRKSVSDRAIWAQENGVFCYRTYESDIPPYAIAIDVYQGAANFLGQTYLVLSRFIQPDSLDTPIAVAEMTEIVSRELNVPFDHIFVKTRHHDRSGDQYKDGQKESHIIYTQEAGYLFEIDLGGYLDTGIFLDHRPVRELIGQMAQGTRFLNLFAYTGTATVHAAGAGASSTTTVDLSQTYLDWAKRNMEHNGFTGNQHRFIRSNAMHWLDRDIRKGVTYDLVFVDPPTFSRSKLKGKKTWSVARDHVELLKKATAVLSADGTVVFSCNLRDFRPDVAALKQEGIRLTDITAQSIPLDFAQNPKIHRCYLVSARH